MPHTGSGPMSWRLAKHRYSLTGTRCGCGQVHFPSRKVCECGGVTLPFTFSGRGTIVTYTTIHVGPAGFERNTPYHVALVKLDEGPVISGIVVDKEIDIGKKVRSVFRRLSADGDDGIINYGFKFELAN